MLLTVDVGNTRVKAAVFEQYSLLTTHVFHSSEFKKKLSEIIQHHQSIQTLVVSSVGKISENDFFEFKKKLRVVVVSRDWNFPFQNKYTTPETLGIDRMVLAAGAILKFPQINRLVIDAGTCITYDYINENEEYLGGAISPGIQMRYTALHNYTAKLPLLEVSKPNGIIGDSTLNAIHSGVINGVLFEIKGLINAFKKQNANFIIILTGGDAEFLANQLKNTIFAHSNFLLESLNLLYQYQKND